MDKNYFEIVFEKMSEKMEKFNLNKLSSESFQIKNEKNTYEVKNETKKKVIVLKEIADQSEKIISSWMFDEETISQKDIKMIVDDFASAIIKSPKANSKFKKKKNSGEESNITGLFFANRMANIFPEIKEKILAEKEISSEFRAVKFTKENILPLINELLNSKKSGNPEVKKLGKLLSDLYQNATLDVRSIITMGVLNNIENAESLKNNISEELKKAWDCSIKYKGKKIKPEKPKKKNSLISKALEYQQENGK